VSGGEGTDRHGLDALEAAVARAAERLRLARITPEHTAPPVRSADARAPGGDLEGAGLSRRIAELETENEDLRARMSAVRERVERLLARIRFLEEQR